MRRRALNEARHTEKTAEERKGYGTHREKQPGPDGTEGMEKLRIENLEFTYAGAERPVLRGVNLRLRAGEFALLTGETGSGKSTLLRLIKRELAPRGLRRGRVLLDGRDTDALSDREAAERIGFVFQRAEQQIVTDRVWHELAFGLENLGVPEREMRRRVAETAQFFGMEELMDARPDRLSGGQKQTLNLAAVMVMEPEVLILDEPTARLDPIAARSFLAMVERLNREMGITVLMAEHRTEDILDRADRLILMERGTIRAEGRPEDVCGTETDSPVLDGALPAAARIWRKTGRTGTCPLNAGEGRTWLAERLGRLSAGEIRRGETGPAGGGTDTAGAGKRRAEEAGTGREKTEAADAGTGRRAGGEALSFREVWFRFTREGKDILRSADFTVREGEIFALLGGNGSGKTTLLRTAAGLIRPYSGEIRLFGKKIGDWRHGTLRHEGVAMLPQDPQTLFLRNSVAEELKDSGLRPEELPFDLSGLTDRHPYDLSGGEQQLLGLAKALAGKPRLLLLDEPTGGLDAAWRSRIRELIRDLRTGGVTILMVTHDAEFAAETADRCGLLFRGRVEAADEPHAFFAGAGFYGTPVSRMTRGLLAGCLTAEEAAEALRACGTGASTKEPAAGHGRKPAGTAGTCTGPDPAGGQKGERA